MARKLLTQFLRPCYFTKVIPEALELTDDGLWLKNWALQMCRVSQPILNDMIGFYQGHKLSLKKDYLAQTESFLNEQD